VPGVVDAYGKLVTAKTEIDDVGQRDELMGRSPDNDKNDLV